MDTAHRHHRDLCRAHHFLQGTTRPSSLGSLDAHSVVIQESYL